MQLFAFIFRSNTIIQYPLMHLSGRPNLQNPLPRIFLHCNSHGCESDRNCSDALAPIKLYIKSFTIRTVLAIIYKYKINS